MHIMTGVYKHSLDNKGRIFIPTKLREDLGDMFFITVSVDNCLCAYSAADWKGLTDKVNSMPYINQRKMSFMHMPPDVISMRRGVC